MTRTAPSRGSWRRLNLVLLATLLSGACAPLGTAPGPVASAGAPPALAPCPLAPPCRVTRENAGHAYVAPLTFKGPSQAAFARLEALLKAERRAEITTKAPGYLKAVFRTPIMGYRDDVEFLLLREGEIGLRSASRLGLWDGGTNARRLKALREAFVRSAGAVGAP